MTHPSDIAGLSERLSDPRIDGAWYLRQDAKAAIDSLTARVKELEAKERETFQKYVDANEARIEAESRALRAEQQRDEAYERAAKAAWDAIDPSQEGLARICAEQATTAIRRLASGPGGGAKPQESKP